MKKFIVTSAAAGALAVAALGLAGAATAASNGGSNAADTVRSLQGQGFTVQLNGSVSAPLSQCIVTDVHGLSNSNVDAAGTRIDPTQFTRAVVDVNCPSSNN
jgi:hypothetical protein